MTRNSSDILRSWRNATARLCCVRDKIPLSTQSSSTVRHAARTTPDHSGFHTLADIPTRYLPAAEWLRLTIFEPEMTRT